jgi:hypothetical protein
MAPGRSRKKAEAVGEKEIKKAEAEIKKAEAEIKRLKLNRCIYKSIKMHDERERSLLEEEYSGENPDENLVLQSSLLRAFIGQNQ